MNTQFVISGITSLSDAKSCIAAGATALGFIFYDDPRKISMQKAADIVSELSPFTSIMGEFMDFPIDKVKLHQRICKLSTARLCGTENTDYIRRINCKVIKVIRLKPDLQISNLKENSNFFYDFKMNYRLKNDGNRKMLFDKARQAIKHFPKSILSGGINPDNVKDILKLSPYAIRLNSGVESFIGKKDINKIKKIKGVILE